MKKTVAISIDSELFRIIEQIAEDYDMSKSKVFTRLVEYAIAHDVYMPKDREGSYNGKTS